MGADPGPESRSDVPNASSRASFDPLGRQLNVTARVVRALLDSTLAEAGITFSDWLVLSALSTRGPSIQRDLGKHLDMIGASMVERIDQLESAGLVERSPVPEDRRASLVALTAPGARLYKQVHKTMGTTEKAIVAGLTPTEIATTRKALSHIADRARELRTPRS